MGIVSRTFTGPNLHLRFGHESPVQPLLVAGWTRKYRLTLLYCNHGHGAHSRGSHAGEHRSRKSG